MKVTFALFVVIMTTVGVFAAVSCSRKNEAPQPLKEVGPAEKAGAVLDRAAERTGDVLNTAAEKTSDAVEILQ